MSKIEIECEICKEKFIVEEYVGGICPKCGQEYKYDEKISIKLSEEQKIALRAILPKNL